MLPSARIRLAGLAAWLTALASAADPPKPNATPFVARTVTLKDADISLDKALDELQRQADVSVDRSRAETSRSFKIDCDKLPFWEALERVAKGADHRITFGGEGRRVMLMAGEGVTYKELPMSVDGPFRLAAKRVVAMTDLENDRGTYEVHLDLHWEPHFAVFLVEPPGEHVTAKDNNDRQLQIAETGKGRITASGGGVNLVLRLQDVPRAARTISVAEGKFSLIGAGSILRFEIPSPGVKETVEKKDGVAVKVRADFKEGSDLWTAYVTMEYPEGGPMIESFEAAAWTADVQAQLVSTDGKRRVDVNGGVEWVNQTDRTGRVNFRWVPDENTKLGKPSDWRLVVQTPGKFSEGTVNFKLTNIPLP